MDIVNWSFSTMMSIFIIIALYIARQAFLRYAKPGKLDIVVGIIGVVLVFCMYAIAYGLNQAFAPVPVCIQQ